MSRLPSTLAALVATALLAGAPGCGGPRAGTDPPDAAFVARSLVPPGELVTFDAKDSRDNGLIMSYAFDYGDDSPREVLFSPEAQHVYGVAGSYTVQLTVADDLGNEGIWSAQVEVTDAYEACSSDRECSSDSRCIGNECWLARPQCFSSADCAGSLTCQGRRCR